MPLPLNQNLVTLLSTLDADQAHVAAWEPSDGNCRVVAAAGSGKTRSVVALTARLAEAGIVPAERIVVTTFSRKAADELNERFATVTTPDTRSKLRVGTFHGLALRAIRATSPGAYAGTPWDIEWSISRCLDVNGKTRMPSIPSPDVLWRSAVQFGNMPGTGIPSLRLDGDPKNYARACDLLRAAGYDDPSGVPAAELPDRRVLPRFAEVWEMVNASKKALGAWDFADALAAWRDGLWVGAINASADVIIVDEAQDNSKVQLDIVRLLTGKEGKIVLVGDLRQCIHVWRGAYPDLFRDADTALSAGTRQIRTNYRSAPAIVKLGNDTSHGRPWALGDAATAHRGDVGGVKVWGGFASDETEAQYVAERIASDVQAGANPSDFAVLCRTNAGVGMFQAMLTEAKVPCAVVGGTSIFAHREVETFLCYLIVAERDAYNALGKMVNVPTRYIGARFVTQVQETSSRGAGMGLLDAIKAVTPTLSPGSARGARDLYDTIARLRRLGWEEKIEAVLSLLAGVERAERKEASEGEDTPDEDKPALYRCAASIARRFANATDLYAFATRCADNAANVGEGDTGPGGRVTLSTIHRSKGREWPTVYAVASEDVLPHHRSATASEIEGERRLFYVAATRARDQLILLWNNEQTRSRSGGPSQFLDLVDQSLWLTPQTDVASAAGTAPDDDGDDDPEGGGSRPPLAIEAAPAPAPAPAPSVGRSWAETVAFAEAATAAEPACIDGEGGRSVPVTVADVAALLEPAGYTQHTAVGQRVWDSPRVGGVAQRVYSSIPENGSVSAAVNEDSIKIATLWFGSNDAGEPVVRPVLPKDGYACRTRGWRLTVLRRTEAAWAAVAAIPPCPLCGAPTRERTSTRGPFRGCIGYPVCRGIAKA